MKINYKKTGLWIFAAVCIFALFRWLFGMGMPGAALEFSLGTTVIIMGGLLAGRYTSRIWFKTNNRLQNIILIILVVLIIIGFFLFAFLVNTMMGETEFFHFFLTVVVLFFECAFVGAVISLVRNRIRTNIQSTRNALAQSKTELQALQSQLSPHFLFNTLNNLYGLSIADHQKVPGLLLKLSDLLRYSVYEVKETFVSLKDEVNYLRNYIEFEKIRLGDRLEMKLDFAVIQDQQVRIAPMLLIVFLENAFKHSKNNQDEKIFIEISLQVLDSSIVFSVKNSFLRAQETSELVNKHSGFGLENVRKRLELLYNNAHQLKIEESDKWYAVKLILLNK